MMVANFDLNYLSYFLMNFKNSCAITAFFKTTPTFAISMRRSRQNTRNKVRTQLWDTLYITGYTSKKAGKFKNHRCFRFSSFFFRLSVFPLLSFSLVPAFDYSDLSTHASSLRLQYRGSYTKTKRSV